MWGSTRRQRHKEGDALRCGFFSPSSQTHLTRASPPERKLNSESRVAQSAFPQDRSEAEPGQVGFSPPWAALSSQRVHQVAAGSPRSCSSQENVDASQHAADLGCARQAVFSALSELSR